MALPDYSPTDLDKYNIKTALKFSRALCARKF